MYPPQRDISWMPGATRRLRRGLALIACLGVVAWSLLFATHLHGHEAESRDHAPVCAVCLAVPVGAAPPAQLAVSVPACPAAPLAAGRAALPLATRAFSAYRSRGPPAA